MAIDRYSIVLAVRERMNGCGYTPHPRSFINNTTKMNELIGAVAGKLMAQGYSEEDVKRAMVNQTKHLCAAWRGLDENSNFIVDKYVAASHAQGDSAPSPNSSENHETEGETGESNTSQSTSGQEAPEQVSGSSGFVDPTQDFEENENGEWNGQDQNQDQDQDQNDSHSSGQTNYQFDQNGGDDPVTDDYEPPSIWFKCVRIIRWNLAHPGEAKNIMLVGPKGIGKTKMVFELSKKFFQKKPYAITAPQMEFKICGFNNAMGEEVKTPVTKGYVDEEGAIILVDEIDRMDAGAGIALNMATANKSMDTPNGMIEQADRVTFIATANTSGTGATNDYNTANQLDASTRDRWIYLLMEWDHNVALKVARGDAALVKGLEDWNTACDKIQYTSGQLSYRTIIDILDLMDMGCFTFEEAIEAAMLKYAIPKSNLMGIYNQMQDHFNKVAKAVKTIMEKMPDNDNLF